MNKKYARVLKEMFGTIRNSKDKKELMFLVIGSVDRIAGYTWALEDFGQITKEQREKIIDRARAMRDR